MSLEARADAVRSPRTLEWEGAPSDLQSMGPAFQARSYLVRRVFQRLRPSTLLDIGCGRGNITAVAASFAREIYAVDLAPEAAAATRARLAGHPNAHAGVANVLSGEWGGVVHDDMRFDAVMLSEVIEHLDDDLAMLIRARSLLSPGGRLVVTVPAKPELWTEWDDLAGHVRRYTRASLFDVVSRAGFQVESLRSWGFPLSGWLATRGARMRGRRVQAGDASEVPSGIKRLMPLAAAPLRALARFEAVFSRLDLGAGYVLVARIAPPAAAAPRVPTDNAS